ncbi:MAG: phosphoribosyltransferase family protein [Candidatus Aenigmatarchaeota archaeon]
MPGTPRFESLLKDISYVFKTGRVPDSSESEIGGIREVILWGSRAIGAGYRVRKHLQSDYSIQPVTSADQEVQATGPTILYLNTKNFKGDFGQFRAMVSRNDNIRLLVVDPDGEHSRARNAYCIYTNYFLSPSDQDIDPAISRMLVSLYRNMDYAVEEDGVRFPDGRVVKPYFRTSVLINYPRTRDILEGVLSSAVRKFNPDVLASREVSGRPPEDDVRMYELAEPIARKLGLSAVKLTRKGSGYVAEHDLGGAHVLLLEDVVGTGETKLALVEALENAKGNVRACVVLLDRMEGAAAKLGACGVELYSVADMTVYQEMSRLPGAQPGDLTSERCS